jgi:hypothetical protein
MCAGVVIMHVCASVCACVYEKIGLVPLARGYILREDLIDREIL